MKTKILFLVLILLAACSQQQKVAPGTEPRLAIATAYVGVPTMSVLAEPRDAAAVVTTYGYTEAVSILSRKGEWVELRTVDGSGWARAKDLITSAEVEGVLKQPTPKFATPPIAVPMAGKRGEIVLEAKVNTDGDVIDVKPVSNTTGSKPLETANVEALRQAKFYPMIQKGQRVTFFYQHRIDY